MAHQTTIAGGRVLCPGGMPKCAGFDLPVHNDASSVYREIPKIARKYDFNRLVDAPVIVGVQSYEMGPNFARVERNAFCTVTVACDCT